MLKIKFIKSNKYDTAFVKENMMGPNALKIIEELFDSLNTVFAINLWISATENYKRIKSMGLEEKIMPIHAEAHYLHTSFLILL